METLAQIYARHSGLGKFNDKGTVHDYITIYEEILKPYRETGERVLEIGLFDGFSYRMWREYFHNADVHGIDCDVKPHGGMANLWPLITDYPEHIHIFDATDAAIVTEKFYGRNLFSVIIDDASHQVDQQVKLFDVWNKYLAPGGLYVVEDIQDLDKDRIIFETLGFEILDRRHKNKRYDNVLSIWRKT